MVSTLRPRPDGRPAPDALAGLGLDQLVEALAERVASKIMTKLAPLLAAPMPGELLTIAEAAALTKLLPSWLKAAARRGDIRSRKAGKYRLFDRAELLEDVKGLTTGA